MRGPEEWPSRRGARAIARRGGQNPAYRLTRHFSLDIILPATLARVIPYTLLLASAIFCVWKQSGLRPRPFRLSSGNGPGRSVPSALVLENANSTADTGERHDQIELVWRDNA